MQKKIKMEFGIWKIFNALGMEKKKIIYKYNENNYYYL